MVVGADVGVGFGGASTFSRPTWSKSSMTVTVVIFSASSK